LKILSLFSGIGGLELGLEAAGVGRTHWQVEKDPYCRSVLAKHWPDAERFEDVRSVTAEDFPGAELICGGFPCQDISAANANGSGLAGDRSSLFWEIARLARSIRSIKFLVLENVPTLSSVRGGLREILRELAQSRFNVEWDTLSAGSVGALHRRDRIFIIAERVSPDTHGKPLRDYKQRSKKRRHHLQTSRKAEPSHNGPKRGLRLDPWASESGICGAVDGVPTKVDRSRLRALGNAVVPQVAYQVGLRINELRGNQ